MKLLARLALMLAAASVLPACSGKPTAPPAARTGSLSIEPVQRSGRNFNANVGSFKESYVVFRVWHGERMVEAVGADGKPSSDFRDAWVLPGAPRPTILVAGQTWLLITEDDARAKVTTAAQGEAGTVQWLDAQGGLGPVFRSAVRHDAKDRRVLEGGHLLLLNGHTVLDVSSLQVRALNLEVPAGYSQVGDPAGRSPDGRKLVLRYRGESNSPHDELLVSTDLTQHMRELLPFDATTMGADASLNLPHDWLSRYFEWTAGADHGPILRQRTSRSESPWTTRYEFGAAAPKGRLGPMPRYSLWPVLPAMLPAARTVVVDELKAEPAAAQPGDQGSPQFIRLSMWIVPVVMRYDTAQQALIVESEWPDGPLHAQAAVSHIGELLDAKLADGSLLPMLASASKPGGRKRVDE